MYNALGFVCLMWQIDEIVDRDLRIPFIMSEDSIDLIRKMLDRDLSTRPTMTEVLKHPVCRPLCLPLTDSGSMM